MNRRQFVLATAASAVRVRGANDRVRAGVIGAGGRVDDEGQAGKNDPPAG